MDIGQQIPPMQGGVVTAERWNAMAKTLNVLRKINLGPGLRGNATCSGISLDTSAGNQGTVRLSFPWGAQWVCGIETGMSDESVPAFEVRIHNPFPRNAVANASMGNEPRPPLKIRPVVGNFNANAGKGILCVTGVGGDDWEAGDYVGAGLAIVPEWSDDLAATHTPIYVLEYSGDLQTVTGISIAFDIVHGCQEDPLPPGYVRLYRGAVTAAIDAGKWYHMGLSVGEGLGREASLTLVGSLGTLADAQTCVPLYDMPDPYESAVPEYILPRDRTDFVIASTGAPCPMQATGNPYLVPGESVGNLVSKSVTDIATIVKNASRTDQEEFQLNNLWCKCGTQYAIVPKPYATQAPVLLSSDGVVSLQGTDNPGTPGENQYIIWGPTGDTWGLTTITIKPDTDTDIASISPAIVIDGETVEDQIGVGLLGDVDESKGVYYADGETGRGFMPLQGSVEATDDAIQLQGDTDAATEGHDVWIYTYDRSSLVEEEQVRKWAKKAVPEDPLEEVDDAGARVLRLRTVNDAGIPTTPAVYAYVVERDSNGDLLPSWKATIMLQV